MRLNSRPFERFRTALSFTVLALTIVAAPMAHSQEGSALKTLELPAGIAVPLPDGWRGSPGNAVTGSIVAPDGQTTVIVTFQPASLAEIAQQLAGPIDLGQGIVLTPVSAARTVSGYSTADFTVAGTPVPARGVVLLKPLSGGRVLGLVGIAPVGSVEAMRKAQVRMISGAVLSAAAPSAQPTGPGGSGWANYLRGRYLVRLYTGNGYQEKEEIWLCSDGTYASASEGGGFTAGVASGAFGSNRRGTWSATGETSGQGVLSLTAVDGTRGQRQVRLGADGVYLNGVRWLRGDNARCR